MSYESNFLYCDLSLLTSGVGGQTAGRVHIHQIMLHLVKQTSSSKVTSVVQTFPVIQSKLSLPRCCGRPDALLPEAVRWSTIVLIVAHEGMKVVVLRDVGDVSP